MNTPHLVEIRNHLDARGALGVIEGADLPFDIRRLYYLFDVPIGSVRGEHGHKRLQQLILCLHGKVDITLNDGRSRWPFTLDRATQGLYVPPGMWRSLEFRDPGTVVCVLASRPYEVEDYIYHFEDFLAWVQAGRPLPEDQP
ncbi:sugar 3,4-ketoisomerase [Plastorhodobacter daqingensis]|uniref:Sugar 3,4-ketoisomerase n=1 Tax=Plastorhodobacter daqingensis TaxID=1387281 RepID=A0ABW2UNE6_9RHOB